MPESVIIVRDPAILGGKPIIAGTRISVELIREYAENGLTVADICGAHRHLTTEQVEFALAYRERDDQ